jgi:peptide/nickel transport system substrate-binding protein
MTVLRKRRGAAVGLITLALAATACSSGSGSSAKNTAGAAAPTTGAAKASSTGAAPTTGAAPATTNAAPTTGAAATKPAGPAPKGKINISDGQAGAYVENFNPFLNGSQLNPTQGEIYETLEFFDQAKAGSVTPELATGSSWNSDGTQLTVTLRDGVKWSDGQAFTADDVAFTFNLIRDNQGLNTFGLPLKAATVVDPTHVTIDFTAKAYTDLWYVMGQTYMVPKHLWASVKDPAKYTNTSPVGTGAFVLKSFSPQVFKLVANPSYWDTGKPHIAEMDYTSYSGNDSATAALASGQLDWAGLFIPDVQNVYVNKDKAHNLYDVAHLFQTDLNPNLLKWPSSDLAVRKAISDGLDRATIIKQVYSGIAAPASPVHMVQPTFAKYVDAKYKSTAFGPVDVAKAQADLTAAGYTKHSDGFFYSPSHGKLTVTCLVVTGWSDYISLLQIAKQNLAKVGIDFEPQQVSYNDFKANEASGNFEFVIDNNGGGPSPYFTYNNLLNSKNAAAASPDHKATSNWSGYADPATDKLLATIAGEADDTDATALAAYAQLEGIFVDKLPYIEVDQAGNLSEFTNKNASGWPSAANQYALSPIWEHPDGSIVAKTITPN